MPFNGQKRLYRQGEAGETSGFRVPGASSAAGAERLPAQSESELLQPPWRLENACPWRSAGTSPRAEIFPFFFPYSFPEPAEMSETSEFSEGLKNQQGQDFSAKSRPC